MMEAVRTAETLVNNHFTWQYNPEDSSEHIVLLLNVLQINRRLLTYVLMGYCYDCVCVMHVTEQVLSNDDRWQSVLF
jgi:hypothetical protein